MVWESLKVLCVTGDSGHPILGRSNWEHWGVGGFTVPLPARGLLLQVAGSCTTEHDFRGSCAVSELGAPNRAGLYLRGHWITFSV